MSDNRTAISRREFLVGSAVTAGAIGLGGIDSVVAMAGEAQPKLGAALIGKLEGPEIIVDRVKWPKAFKEAPMLAELVKAGKLPPVEQRIPEEPMVIKPVHGIGRYGGVWQRGFTGPADGPNASRLVASSDQILFCDYTGTNIGPCLAHAWQMSEDGRVITIFLRKGHKWSDGHPFTADDFVFWYEDIYLNKDIQPGPHKDMTVNGKPARLYKRDSYTVVFEFPDPNYLFVDVLAGPTAMGGGQATQQQAGLSMGAYMPAHYLKQFHPKYVSKDELDRKVKAAGFDSWVTYLKSRWDWARNPDVPVVGPWKTVMPINTPIWRLERNPYYYGVDTAGNQLPYIDRVDLRVAENLEVLNLRAMAGQYDCQERHTILTKLPVFLENRAKGNYDVRLDPSISGSEVNLNCNQAYDADPEIAKWLHTRDFRRALSLAIDRDQLNEAFWLGLGTPGSSAPSETVPESPGPEWRKKWSVYDPTQATKLLDALDLKQRDGEGYRLRSDGKGRIRIELLTCAASLFPFTQIAEMIQQHWKKVGIQADVKEAERSLFYTRMANDEHQIVVWLNDGSDQVLIFPRYTLPVDRVEPVLGHGIALWYSTSGERGKAPKDPALLKVIELYRSAPGKKTEERRDVAQQIWRILVDEQFTIGTVGQSPAGYGLRIVSKRMGNVPAREVNANRARTPGSSHPATFYFKS